MDFFVFGFLNILGNEIAIEQGSVSSNRPNEATEDETTSQWNINYDLFHRRFLLITNRNQVASPHPPDPSRNVEEQKSRCYELSPMPLVSVHYQVW